jgi:hypothetical protein
MDSRPRSSWLSVSLALAVCLACSASAQAKGSGGHASAGGPQAPSARANASRSTSDWRTHIHPQMLGASAKKAKKPAVPDISVTKKLDSSSPKMMSSKAPGGFKPSKSRTDPYKNYNFR